MLLLFVDLWSVARISKTTMKQSAYTLRELSNLLLKSSLRTADSSLLRFFVEVITMRYVSVAILGVILLIHCPVGWSSRMW